MATSLVNGGPDTDELQRLYNHGDLEFLKEPLKRFFVSHRNELLEFNRRHQADTVHPSLEASVEEFIRERRSIDMEAEAQDQYKEIQKELWFVHENHPEIPDDKIKYDWIKKYAARWRAYYVSEILFVFEQNKSYYLELLH